MRLYLVSPTHRQRDGSRVKATQYWTSGLTLPTLKALTPPPWQVDLVDELIGDVDLDKPCDVVGITAMGPPPSRNRLRHTGSVVANLKSHMFLRREPSAWGTIS